MPEQIVHLALVETLADWEPGYAVAAINSQRYQREPGSFGVRTVAAATEPVTTLGGVRMLPDITFAELDPADSAMLVLPGADTWQGEQNAEAIAAARSFLDADTPVAAICGATYALAAAGMLDDRDHTGAAAEVLAASGYAGAERYREQRAVNDRGLITAGPTAPVDFAREILAELEVMEPAALDAWFGLYSTGEARYFFDLMGAVA